MLKSGGLDVGVLIFSKQTLLKLDYSTTNSSETPLTNMLLGSGNTPSEEQLPFHETDLVLVSLSLSCLEI